MANFIFAYQGGAEPATDAEGEAVMAAWMEWFGSLGGAVVDAGNPFGRSKTVEKHGVSEGGSSDLSGYSIVSAADLDEATDLAKGCPILNNEGSVEVYEIHQMM